MISHMGAPPPPTPGTAGFALLVGSDPRPIAMYSKLLGEVGMRVAVLTDGEVALRALSSGDLPRLVIIDLSLAKFDGFAVLAALRLRAAPERVPALAMSAFPTLRKVARKHLDNLGVSALLSKTTTREAVHRAVRRALAGIRRIEEDERRDFDTLAKKERTRLERLAQSKLIEDLAPQAGLSAVVAKAAGAFGVPMAMLTLVRDDGEWFKAHQGLSPALINQRGIPLSASISRHVIGAESDEPLIIPDATRHPCFNDNPLVKSGAFRGYAGAALVSPQGDALGVLSIMDQRPLTIGSAEASALVLWARQAAGELALAIGHRQRASAAAGTATLVAPSGVHALGAMQGDLTQSLPLLRTLFAALDSGVMLFGPDRTLMFANEAAPELLALPAKQLIKQSRDQVVTQVAGMLKDKDGFAYEMRVLPTGPVALRNDLELLWPQRRVLRWIEQPVALGATGNGQLVVLTDVSAEVDLEAERERLARSDTLTGLSNRRGGEEAIVREVARAHRHSTPLGFVYFDLDNFRQVNETYGYPVGDRVLREIATMLAKTLRGGDFAVRWGGEELLAVLPGTALDGAQATGERIRVMVEKTVFEGVGSVTISAGCAELMGGEGSAEAIARADYKLYEAKRGGRNCVQ